MRIPSPAFSPPKPPSDAAKRADEAEEMSGLPMKPRLLLLLLLLLPLFLFFFFLLLFLSSLAVPVPLTVPIHT